MRVGLYGGSFNPAHGGHAHVAETALARLGLDRVIWLVSPQNPLKGVSETAPLALRLAGAARRARGAAMIVSDAESRMGARYSVDTVRRLKARFPGVRFVWIMGADSLASLHFWRDWRGLIRALPLAIVARPRFTLTSLNSPAARRFADARLPESAARRLAVARPPAWLYLTGRWDFSASTALRNSP